MSRKLLPEYWRIAANVTPDVGLEKGETAVGQTATKLSRDGY